MTCHMAISQLLSHKASGDHIDPHRSGLQLAPLHVNYVVVYQYSYLNSMCLGIMLQWHYLLCLVLLQLACRRGSFDTVRRILESKQAGINGNIITEVSQLIYTAICKYTVCAVTLRINLCSGHTCVLVMYSTHWIAKHSMGTLYVMIRTFLHKVQ